MNDPTTIVINLRACKPRSARILCVNHSAALAHEHGHPFPPVQE